MESAPFRAKGVPKAALHITHSKKKKKIIKPPITYYKKSPRFTARASVIAACSGEGCKGNQKLMKQTYQKHRDRAIIVPLWQSGFCVAPLGALCGAIGGRGHCSRI